MFSREQMQRAIEDALKQMEGVALELYRRGREEARAELAEANARRADLRTALEWANEERDRLREQLAAKHSECPDCAMYAERSARFAEQADQMQRERDEARASVADAYRRGAEAMREACAAALLINGLVVSRERAAATVRALPIPEAP
jgi:chromosome segregation ATPase